MNTFRVALANLPFPPTPEESVASAVRAIAEASAAGAGIICFPECFVPGYRSSTRPGVPPDAAFLERAWATVAAAAARGNIAFVVGT